MNGSSARDRPHITYTLKRSLVPAEIEQAWEFTETPGGFVVPSSDPDYAEALKWQVGDYIQFNSEKTGSVFGVLRIEKVCGPGDFDCSPVPD